MADRNGPGDDRQAGRGRKTAGKSSVWEWVAAGVGTLLVLGTVAFMLFEAFTRSGGLPVVSVRVDTVVSTPAGYLVWIRAENRGGETAASLRVEGELRSGTRVVETRETTLAFVPAEGKRYAGLVFREDPGRYTLDVRATGFELP